MSKFAVILPAAGNSSRFKDRNNKKKPFVDLKGRAVWLRAAEVFQNRDDVVQILVVISPDDMEMFKDRFRPNLAFMAVEVVEGGQSRAESVLNALKQVRDDAQYVAIHDAARPLLVGKWVDDVFAAATQSGAAIPGVRVASTLKKSVNGVIEKTVPRENLWQAQTPQVFEKQLLLDAYQHPDAAAATDEASLVERTGKPVSIVESSPMNIKITTRADLRMAEALLAALPKDKGIKSLHPFAGDDGLIF